MRGGGGGGGYSSGIFNENVGHGGKKYLVESNVLVGFSYCFISAQINARGVLAYKNNGVPLQFLPQAVLRYSANYE